MIDITRVVQLKAKLMSGPDVALILTQSEALELLDMAHHYVCSHGTHYSADDPLPPPTGPAMTTNMFSRYWELIDAGDYDGALAEAFAHSPPIGPAGIDRDFYIRHMVDNHLPVEKRKP